MVLALEATFGHTVAHLPPNLGGHRCHVWLVTEIPSCLLYYRYYYYYSQQRRLPNSMSGAFLSGQAGRVLARSMEHTLQSLTWRAQRRARSKCLALLSLSLSLSCYPQHPKHLFFWGSKTLSFESFILKGMRYVPSVPRLLVIWGGAAHLGWLGLPVTGPETSGRHV